MEPIKISVVIPVYNTSKYLIKCLDSVIKQTHQNLEIIVVDDCSTDDSLELMREYGVLDSRIKVIQHSVNRGLFQARLSGADVATGDYLTFLDSDDFLGLDNYRRLVIAAFTENADIIESNFVMVNEKDEYYVNSMNRASYRKLEGDKVQQVYFAQRGQANHWSVVWNKLYRKDLWDKCRPYYDGIQSHLIMTEDILYSTVLFTQANKYISIEYDGYFYRKHSSASTSLNPDTEKLAKQIHDVETVFNFCEDYLSETVFSEKYADDFTEWKRYYFRLWCTNIKELPIRNLNKQKLYDQLKKSFKQQDISLICNTDHNHYFESAEWNGHHYERLIQQIQNTEIEYISFDIFDTLIKRPFYAPQDLFWVMDAELIRKFPSKVKLKFSELRVRAEREVRLRIGKRYPSYEEVTLDEIYTHLQQEYSVIPEVVQYAKELEVKLELKYCSARKSVKEIFELAQELNKRIIIISDMYLPQQVIEQILHGNGYTGYMKLYISSETRLTKHHGSLFKHVLQDLGAEPKSVIHIGDNWEADYVNSSKQGIYGFFYPKATSVLMGEIKGSKSNHLRQLLTKSNHGFSDHRHFMDYFGHRSMLGVVANHYFDNPFRQFNVNSEFNLDPYFIGYFALGMNMLATGLWLQKETRKNKYRTLHFVARDGYLIKKVFDKINSYSVEQINSNYVYLSRRSIIPMTLSDKQDLFALYNLIDHTSFTPKRILSVFLHIDDDSDEMIRRFKERNVIFNKSFSSSEEFNHFVQTVIDLNLIDEEFAEYRKRVLNYFQSIFSENDAMFDIGYNGSTQIMLSNFLEQKIDAFYVHLNSDKALRPYTAPKSNTYSFLDYTPAIRGTIREYLFSEPTASCAKYNTTSDGKVSFVFGEDHNNNYDRYVIDRIHNGVLDFVDEFLSTYHECLELMTFRNYEVSLPLEDLLHQPTLEDQKVFANSTFDDIIRKPGQSERIGLLDIWRHEIQNSGYNSEINSNQLQSANSIAYDPYHHLENKTTFQKAIYFMLFDFRTFKKRLAIKYKYKVLKRPLHELLKDL